MLEDLPLSELPQYGGHLCLDFANTLVGINDTRPYDALTSPEEYRVFARRNGLEVSTDGGEAALRRARELRASLVVILRAVASSAVVPERAVSHLGRVVRKSFDDRALVPRPGGVEWRQAVFDLDAVTKRIAAEAVRLLESKDAERVRQCGGERCGWFFLDTSRNGKRRWCSMRYCGNRAKVRRHRHEAADTPRH
jgi:predicted RNA-binding Zn ribbon-like protein